MKTLKMLLTSFGSNLSTSLPVPQHTKIENGLSVFLTNKSHKTLVESGGPERGASFDSGKGH
jgi:hypothetical protein